MPQLLSNWTGHKLGASPYQIVRVLQLGGMAIVYLGQELHTGRPVVVKTPRPDSPDETLAARLESEIEALRLMAHPHIVPILDAGEHEGVPFLVLPYLEGGTLLDRIHRERTTQSVPSLDWLLPIAQALDFLHSHGWIHRDVKPGNILFDGGNTPYLADLGLTKCYTGAVRRSLTRLGVPSPGTPRYMSPELLTGEVADGRGDQFSLAVMLYEMLTGLAPYAGDNPTAVLRNQALVQPTPLRQVRRDLTQALSDVVARGMSLRPTQRFATCLEFVQAFLAALPAAATALPSATELNPRTWSIEEFPALALPEPPPAVTPLPAALASAPAPAFLPSPTAIAPGPGRWPQRMAVFCALLASLFLGGVFLPGTTLHRHTAGPVGEWLQTNLNLTLPWMRQAEEAEVHKNAEERLKLELADEKQRAEAAQKRLASLEETVSSLTTSANTLKEDLEREKAHHLARQKELDDAKEKVRTALAQVPSLKAGLSKTEGIIEKAARLHEEIDARVVLINNTDRRVSFKLKGQLWDEAWSPWQEHSLAAGTRDTFTVPQAIWLRVQVAGSEEHEDIRPQIFLRGRDKMSVDVHYQFDQGTKGVTLSRLVRAK